MSKIILNFAAQTKKVWGLGVSNDNGRVDSNLPTIVVIKIF